MHEIVESLARSAHAQSLIQDFTVMLYVKSIYSRLNLRISKAQIRLRESIILANSADPDQTQQNAASLFIYSAGFCFANLDQTKQNRHPLNLN